MPGRYSLLVQPGTDPQRQRVEVPRDGTFERAAALVLACDPADRPDNACTIGGMYPAANTQIRVPGAADAMTFIVDEVLPPTPAHALDFTVRLAGGPEVGLVQMGDRDALLDDRAAVVSAVGSKQTGSSTTVEIRVTAGVDQAHDGWRYRNRPVKPGAPFSLTTDRYIVSGTVVSIAVPSQAEGSR